MPDEHASEQGHANGQGQGPPPAAQSDTTPATRDDVTDRVMAALARFQRLVKDAQEKGSANAGELKALRGKLDELAVVVAKMPATGGTIGTIDKDGVCTFRLGEGRPEWRLAKDGRVIV